MDVPKSNSCKLVSWKTFQQKLSVSKLQMKRKIGCSRKTNFLVLLNVNRLNDSTVTVEKYLVNSSCFIQMLSHTWNLSGLT